MNKLQSITPTKPYLVCIDSDGCVFDSMELKHKECFIPATVNIWNLQGISKYVREAAEFVNLYSNTRGMNRFPALVRTFKLLKLHPAVQERDVRIPDLTILENWISVTNKLSATGLQEYIEETKHVDEVLLQALAWSQEVDRNIEHIVRGVAPFPYVHQNLEAIQKLADIVIVSSTPYDAILREWTEHDMIKYLHGIAGQEQGTKMECIEVLAKKYDKDKIMMIGDALGDRSAADLNQVAFYPIIPGDEVQSWKSFYSKAFQLFMNQKYDNENNEYYYSFKQVLMENPSWFIQD